jgi:hypothetical protein
MVALAFVFYGAEMGPHLLAAASAVLVEAALVLLVLDRLANSPTAPCSPPSAASCLGLAGRASSSSPTPCCAGTDA